MANLTDTVRSLARRTTGMTTDEVPGFTPHQVGGVASRLVLAGELHKAIVNRRSVRYFAHVGLRDAFLLRVKNGTGWHDPKWTDKSMCVAAHEAPRQLPINAPVVIPKGVRVQHCPAFEPRFVALDRANVYGGNQRGRVAA